MKKNKNVVGFPYARTHTFLCVSLCTCKAVRRAFLWRPSKISQVQTKLPAEAGLLSVGPSVHRGQTHTFLLRRPALQGEIYLPHINEKRALSFLIRLLNYHLGRRAAAIFHHPVPPPHTRRPRCLRWLMHNYIHFNKTVY